MFTALAVLTAAFFGVLAGYAFGFAGLLISLPVSVALGFMGVRADHYGGR